MTLAQLQSAAPEILAAYAAPFQSKEGHTVLAAVEQSILDGLNYTRTPGPGESVAECTSRWHSYLAGQREVIKILQNLGKSRPATTTQETEFEHAIPPHLVEAKKKHAKTNN